MRMQACARHVPTRQFSITNSASAQTELDRASVHVEVACMYHRYPNFHDHELEQAGGARGASAIYIHIYIYLDLYIDTYIYI
jgi:hypothetical protein